VSGSQAAQEPAPEEEKPVVEQSDKAKSDEQNKKDAEILKALFAAQMKQQQAASDAALLQSFMDRTKSAVGNAMSNYQMGRSVL
jgi:hypothetical protein